MTMECIHKSVRNGPCLPNKIHMSVIR
jgi:hypothetical protein